MKNKNIYTTFFCLALILLFLLLIENAFGQSEFGSLQGTVTNKSNTPLSNLTVTLKDPAAGILRPVVTDAQSKYLFPALPPAVDIIDPKGEDNNQVEVLLGEAVTRNLKSISGTETAAPTPVLAPMAPMLKLQSQVFGRRVNLPHNYLRDPGLRFINLSLLKKFKKEGKPIALDFRIDFSNIFNMTNFDKPGSTQTTLPNVLGTDSGQLQSGQPFSSVTAPEFGFLTRISKQAQDLGASRQIQFSFTIKFTKKT